MCNKALLNKRRAPAKGLGGEAHCDMKVPGLDITAQQEVVLLGCKVLSSCDPL